MPSPSSSLPINCRASSTSPGVRSRPAESCGVLTEETSFSMPVTFVSTKAGSPGCQRSEREFESFLLSNHFESKYFLTTLRCLGLSFRFQVSFPEAGSESRREFRGAEVASSSVGAVGVMPMTSSFGSTRNPGGRTTCLNLVFFSSEFPLLFSDASPRPRDRVCSPTRPDRDSCRTTVKCRPVSARRRTGTCRPCCHRTACGIR